MSRSLCCCHRAGRMGVNNIRRLVRCWPRRTHGADVSTRRHVHSACPRPPDPLRQAANPDAEPAYAATLPGFINETLISDSVLHEFDAVWFLTDEEITSVQVRLGMPSRAAPPGLNDPQQ